MDFPFRIGQGFDAHKFKKGRDLILGGIHIPSDFGLDGHSDADVLVHAIIDALLGALGNGNIGTWFPDTDKAYKDADSMLLLQKVISSPCMETWDIVNIDSTIIIQKPRLSAHIKHICENLSKTLNISCDRISVKPKTTEGMGFCGRGEGAAVYASVLMAEKKL